MAEYNHLKIERKWQKEWEKKKAYRAESFSKKLKFYGLIEFPYPSGAGLHVGHIRSNTAMDIISRKRRMQGYNVLYPIGWDAFGLPTENYAIKTGIHPIKVTKDNTDTFRRQLKALGFSFDWSLEINTTDPKYYKWTQWIFLQLFKKGLAYKTKTEINWCPTDKIGLANEEVVAGKCERCGTPVEKREKEQWMLAITKYAERLDKDLDTVDYLEKIKIQQRNWIGKSEGAEIEFHLTPPSAPLSLSRRGEGGEVIRVFTTRPDTIFGATYMVLAPEHNLVQKLKSQIKNWPEVLRYIVANQKASDIERTAENKVKTGIELKGIKAINPATKEEIPVWIADYVLASYGTGAIMAVPAHDERDFAFAKKYNLPIKQVINAADFTNVTEPKGFYSGEGWLMNSGQFDGLDSEKAKKEIIKFVGGKEKTTFKLRDWVFSRQRYWGEPIPLIHCDNCALREPSGQGWVPVPEKDLPVVLPKVAKYKPTDTGESPLAEMKSWVNVKCPKCKGTAKRETDTMPNWAGSSWYFLRYTDPKNSKEFASMKNLKYWTPVDWYNGGMEHTTLHLLYSRFWHKFLYDLKLVPGSEPYMKRTSHGMILAPLGEKMSKSKGNTVNPDELIKTYGADTLRMYEMFLGPFDQAVSWNTDSMIGPRRFLERVWRISDKVLKSKNSFGLLQPKKTEAGTFPVQNFSISKLLHKTIKKVSEDIEEMRFNTAISAMMILATEIERAQFVSIKDFKMFLQILAPFAPHITEELWEMLAPQGLALRDSKARPFPASIHLSDWPKWDENLIRDEEIKIAVQVNGKVRTEIMIQIEAAEEEVKKQAASNEIILRHISGREIKKVIYVKNRLINIVL